MSTSREHADVEKRIPEHGGAAADSNAIDIDDPNFDPTLSMVQEESPYAEVRSAVANTDDPTMPASTLRAWVVGLVWAVLIPGANHFYSFRYPSAFVSEHIPMLLTLPICRAWARYVPNRSIFGLPLNPGPFNTKEHVIISVMADVAAESAYGTYVVAVQRVFYDQHPTFAYQYIIGALAPLFQWIIHKKFNRRSLKYLHFPVIFSSTSFMPPATPINYVPFVLGCYLFNYRIRRRHFHWWSKYNYILSAGLDVGYAVGSIIVFFALLYPKNGTIGLSSIQSWWGNVVYTKTTDFAGAAYKTLPDGETFGPSSW